MAFEPKEDGSMSRKRHKPEEIVAKLRQVDGLVAQGTPVADAVRSIGVTEVDHHRELATALQFCSAPCLFGLPAPSSGGVRAGGAGRAGCAHPARSAGQAPRSATTNHELTFTPDHPMGADQQQGALSRSWRAPLMRGSRV